MSDKKEDNLEVVDLNPRADETKVQPDEDKKDNDSKGRKQPKKNSALHEVLSWCMTFVVAIALALLLKNYLIINATVPTGSMEHTIEPGDDLFGLRIAYNFTEPKRGDIIIFKFPDDESEKYVKRIIGLPGDCARSCHGYGSS